jgi:hypothetical protein
MCHIRHFNSIIDAYRPGFSFLRLVKKYIQSYVFTTNFLNLLSIYVGRGLLENKISPHPSKHLSKIVQCVSGSYLPPRLMG